MRLSKRIHLSAVAECIRIYSRVGNGMAIVTRQPAAKILIPDACHIVKPAFLSAMARLWKFEDERSRGTKDFRFSDDNTQLFNKIIPVLII